MGFAKKHAKVFTVFLNACESHSTRRSLGRCLMKMPKPLPCCSSVRIFCFQLLFGIFLTMQTPTRELQKPIHAMYH